MSTEQTPAPAPTPGDGTASGHDPLAAPTRPFDQAASERAAAGRSAVPEEPSAPPQQTGSDAGVQGAPAEVEPARPRTGPIVWGAIVLAVCVYIAAQTLAPGSVDTTTFVIASVIGLGALLLIVGAAVLVRNSRKR